jgi:hypothetical protein
MPQTAIAPSPVLRVIGFSTAHAHWVDESRRHDKPTIIRR